MLRALLKILNNKDTLKKYIRDLKIKFEKNRKRKRKCLLKI